MGGDQCDQNCRNTVGSYTCSCDTGYLLDSDGQTCDGKMEMLLQCYEAEAYMQISTSAVQVLPTFASTHVTTSTVPTHASAILGTGSTLMEGHAQVGLTTV